MRPDNRCIFLDEFRHVFNYIVRRSRGLAQVIRTLINNTPVIMLTANAMMGADQKYLESGFDDYLSKPIRPLTLENMVQKHLPENLIITDASAEVEAPAAEFPAVVFVPGLHVLHVFPSL